MPPTTLVYLGTQNGLVVLSQAGGQWRPVPRGLAGKPVVSLAGPGDNLATFYAAVQGYGVFRSDDTGLSWEQVLGANVHCLLLDPHNPDRLWAGVEPAGVQRSEDGGRTWHDLGPAVLVVPGAVDWYLARPPYEPFVGALASVPGQPETVLAAVQIGGLLRTTDAGAAWQRSDRGLARDVHSLAVHPRDPALWLAATGDGVFRSADGGQSWSEANEGISLSYALAVLILGSGTCLAALASVPPGNWVENAGSVLYRSTDAALSWQPIGLDQPDYLTSLAADPSAPKSAYLGAESGRIWHSQNQGERWRQIGQVSAPINAMLVVRLG
jgi:photosystem II stability/assembly factor-like uncharacterized protein